MIDKKKLTALSPQDRIKKLKLMEEERKKEVDEIGGLIKESMREMKTGKIAEEITPEHVAVDISRLFQADFGGKLELTARKEATRSAPKGNRGYQAVMQAYEAYFELTKFYGKISMGLDLSSQEKEAIDKIDQQMGVAERYMTEGERVASKLDASRAVLYKLRRETGL